MTQRNNTQNINLLQDFQYQQKIQDVGKKLKLTGKIDPNKLKWRNYKCNQEEDSIDVQDIVKGDPTYFQPQNMLHYHIPKNAGNLRVTNVGNHQVDEGEKIFYSVTIKDQPQKVMSKIAQQSYNSIIQSRGIESNFKQKSTQLQKFQHIIQDKIKPQMKQNKKEQKQEQNQNAYKLQELYADFSNIIGDQSSQQTQNIATENVRQTQKSAQIQQQQKQIKIQKKSKHNHRRYRNNRRESFSKQILDQMLQDFATIDGNNTNNVIKQMSARYNLTFANVAKMYKQWQQDPRMAKYTNNKEQPLGALIDGKRERTHSRIKDIDQMLQSNPFLTQKQISDKLFEKDKSKKRVLRSAIIRLLKIAGYKKKKTAPQINQQMTNKITQQRKDFMLKYRQLQKQKANFYYLDQFLLHKFMNRDSFWHKEQGVVSPYDSKKFVADAILLVTLLSPTGNLYWEIRGGDYQKEDYVELLGRMFKKMNGKKASIYSNAVITNDSPLRDSNIIKQIIQNSSGIPLRLPQNSIIMSPLQILFIDLKQKSKRFVSSSQQQVIKKFSQIVSNFKKSDLLNLIEQSKKHMQKAEKGQPL